MVRVPTERCTECSFAAGDWTSADAARTLGHLGLWWSAVDPAQAKTGDGWSELASAVAASSRPDARTLATLHDNLHGISMAGRRRHEHGRGAPRGQGQVVAVNTSRGGVPKAPVPEAMVSHRGVEGDVQAARQHHGRPWQALCVWSADVIDRLRAEGHSIGPGSAGENLTVAGVDWATVQPGVRIQAGELLAEVSLWAIPCAKNAQWFLDGDFNRISHEREPGISRMYASVLRPGRVRPGDAFVIEPA